MDDIEALCERVIVINEGRILSDGALCDLRAKVTRERWLTVDLAAEDEEVCDPDATVIRRDGARVVLAFDPERVSPAVLIGRVTGNHAVMDLFVENPPIEEIVARIYRAD
jgi:ABC-2 type transport system ATP-binding protein